MTRCFLLKASLNSMFVSVQGEGPLVGVRQVFLRFAGCGLSCQYCDTDFSERIVCDYKRIYDFVSENLPVHSVALTGGEPLEQARFLCQLLPAIRQSLDAEVFLETAGYLPDEMRMVRDYIDYVSMDVKVPCVSGVGPLWDAHRRFVCEVPENSELILKLTLAPGMKEGELEEIEGFLSSIERDVLCIVLQPVYGSEGDSEFINGLLDWQRRLMSMLGVEVRIIPQVHKFLGVE